MLSTARHSRRHLAFGSAAVSLLVGSGLALTASSGQAAAVLTAQVDTAPQVPAPPAPPEAAAAPEGPAVPPAPSRPVRKVVVVRDGKTTTYDSADVDAHLARGERVAIAPLARDSSRMIVKADGDPATRVEVQDLPAFRTATCGIGVGKPASMLVQNGRGPKRLIVVCTDRIEAATRHAEQVAANAGEIERTAFAHARTGLANARASIERDHTMNEAQRAEALQGIAEAERELATEVQAD